MEQFAAWPHTAIHDLLGKRQGEDEVLAHARRARLEAALGLGAVLHTDFSGQQCPETGLRMASTAMHKAGLTLPGSPSDAEWLIDWRACDISPLARKVTLSSKHAPEHLFPDVCMRAPPKYLSEVAKLMPKPDAPKMTKALAYDKIRKYLTANRSKIFLPDNKAPCLSHPGKLCPVRWGDPPVPPSFRPLTLNTSGTMCTPWTSYGQVEELADDATPSWWFWVQEMAQLRYDITTLENSPRFPVELYREEMKHHAVCVYAKFGPEDLSR